jgi:group I intron endonuclease
MGQSFKEGIIYLVTNTVNGKRYVGQTVSKLTSRWATHKRCAQRGSTFALHSAIRKYGATAFTIEVVAESLEPFLDHLETVFIKLYNTKSVYGYNMTDGGDGNRGHRWTEEQKQAWSERCKGEGNPFYGKRHSDEVKQAQKIRTMGEGNPFYGKTHKKAA